MRLGPVLALALVFAACAPSPRPRGAAERPAKAIVEPPVPPGYVAAVGPLVLESVEVTRTEIGWDRDLVRATRVVAYDVVVSQRGAACEGREVPGATRDARGCEGVESFPAKCDPGPPMRARFEIEATYAIDVAQRCAGDRSAYVLPERGDARAGLTSAGISCFRQRNKLRPEASWTSVYALTELSIAERPLRVTTDAPRLMSALLAGKGTSFCRDDGAFLSGRPGAPPVASTPLPPAEEASLAAALAQRAPVAGAIDGGGGGGGTSGSSVGLTGGAWKSEHDLWEACNAKEARGDVVAQERCQLLRQLDRFLTEVETAARQETPRGIATPVPTSTDAAASASASRSTDAACKPPAAAGASSGKPPPGATCDGSTKGAP
jgi:hypothetical protein